MCAAWASEPIADASADPESMNSARGLPAIAFCDADSARLALDWLSMTVRLSFFPLTPPFALMLSTATSTPAAPGAETLEKAPDRSETRAMLYAPPLAATALLEPPAPLALLLLPPPPPPPLPQAARATSGTVSRPTARAR
jgi:hypothetical protein